MIAANNVAARRLLELFDRYGLDEVQRVMQLEIEHSEEQLRDRLRELPDGVYRGLDYIEHDGHTNALYDFRLEVRKTGDRLVFDFTGTSATRDTTTVKSRGNSRPTSGSCRAQSAA